MKCHFSTQYNIKKICKTEVYKKTSKHRCFLFKDKNFWFVDEKQKKQFKQNQKLPYTFILVEFYKILNVPQVINTSFGFKIFSFSKNLKSNIVEEIELSLLYRN
ncbi:hypothetical protein BpHYR1_023871 [Brachionus plicatilis]|uniref:Uncharacterized protein n=1 Tax=Brachionus plicatilis TaxID=10195 RepID=A0A3M7QMW0_BRAPC|nr:hypothetical protein BpHYR1_023871 [Brachionus plicatilis]